MSLYRTNAALAGALALMMMGCAADAADEAQGESADDPETLQAVAQYDDVTSADKGSSKSSSSSGGSKASSSSTTTGGADVSSGTGRTSATNPTTGSPWDLASVANLCFFARDPRAAILCRVTLTDCNKPISAIDPFTQILCQLRGFLPGGGSNGGSAAAPVANQPAAPSPADIAAAGL